MASVKFEKGSEEWQMFMDYWNICQKHWKPEKNDAYWEELTNDLNAFIETHGGTDKFPLEMAKAFREFAKSLSVGFVVSQELKLKGE